jgi:aminoglycoside phosphotransferase (APT) family kinase protein
VATLLAGGRSNVTYRVEDASGHALAVRRPPLGHIMPSAHDLVREFTVLQGLHRAGFPVPRPWALCEDESVIGARFLVMDFVEGLVVATTADAAQLTAAEADRVSCLMVDTLARLHSLDVQVLELGELGRPDGYLPRQVRRWGQQWELSKTRELNGVDIMAAWLGDRVTRLTVDMPWSLVHGDYRLDNVILDPRFSSVRAVLDWEMSTLGDPVADLAVALVYWTQVDDVLRRYVPVARDVTSGPGFWRRDRIVEEYARVTGRDLKHLGFCLVLACYKLTVIMESLNYRSLSGLQLGAAAQEQQDLAEAVGALSELGARLVDSPTVETLHS